MSTMYSKLNINKIIIIVALGSVLALLPITKAMGTETLACSCDQYRVQMPVGTTGYFGEVYLNNIIYERDSLKNAYLSWEKRILRLEYLADSSKPSFKVNINGKEMGTLRVNNKTYSIKCSW